MSKYRYGTKITGTETFLLDENTSEKEIEDFLKRNPTSATAVFADREEALKFMDDNNSKGKSKKPAAKSKQESSKSSNTGKAKAK